MSAGPDNPAPDSEPTRDEIDHTPGPLLLEFGTEG
jgi:hypothetical protein